MEIAWQTTHSVEANVDAAFPWAYMTDVANWDDPPARFELDGPFSPGVWGTTYMPGQAPRRWRVSEMRPMESYTIETSLDGAKLSFQWSFTGLNPERTRLTQRIVLSGEKAAEYVDQVRTAFGSNLAAGMTKIAGKMEQSAGPAGRPDS